MQAAQGNKNYVTVTQGEEKERQSRQVNTLLKTIFLLTNTPVNVYILNNDENVFNDTVEEVKAWGVDTDHLLRLSNIQEVDN